MIRTMHLLAFVFALMVLSFKANAEEQTKLLIEGPESVIHLGDVASFDLTLWPIDDLKEISLKLLEGQKIGDSLVVISIERPSVSLNNEQAVESKMTGVFVQAQDLPEKITIGNKQVELLKRSIDVTGEVAPIKELNVFEADRERERIWFWIMIVIIIFIIVFLAYLYRKRSQQMKMLKLEKENENFWSSKLKAAQSRPEIEDVYAKRKQWIKILRPPSSLLAKFCEQIEQVQYKKEWTEEEFREVTQCLNELRRRTLT